MRISIDGIGVRTHMGRPAQSGTVRAEAQGHHHINFIQRHDTTVVVERETSVSCLCRGLVPVLFRVRYLISPAARLS